MKTLLLIFIVVCFACLSLNSQPYQKFCVEQAHWIMQGGGCVTDCEGGNGSTYSEDYKFKLEGDTLLNGFTYKKLFFSYNIYIDNPGSNNEYFSYPWAFVALLRDDTINRKVYYLGNIVCYESLTDTLLYDFSKGVNDSLAFPFKQYISNNCSVISATIDSSNYTGFMSFHRKTFYMPADSFASWPYSRFNLYEGIGPSYGLFGSTFISGGGGPSFSSYLVSYCVGPDSICGEGFPTVTGIKNLTDPGMFRVFPNPANGKIEISGLTEELVLVDIYTTDGQMMLRRTINKSNALIDISYFPSAIYIIGVTNSSGLFHSRIFVSH